MTFKSELLHDDVKISAPARGDVARGLRIVFAPAGAAYFIERGHPAVEVLLVDEHHRSAATPRDAVDRALVGNLLRDARGVAHEVGHGDDFFHGGSIL
jgi:hypothetical protein